MIFGVISLEINSSSANGQGGVIIILDQTMAYTVDKRMMKVRLKHEPVDVVVTQVYIPMTDCKDKELVAVYERIEELQDKETNGKDCTLIVGA